MGPINQTHLKCSPKELGTVVCALRTIVTTCTKNNHCHHSSHKTEPIFLYDENSRPPSCICDEVEGDNNLDDFVSIWRSFALSNLCFKQTKAGTKLKVKKRGIQKKKCLLKSKSIISVIRRWLSAKASPEASFPQESLLPQKLRINVIYLTHVFLLYISKSVVGIGRAI